MLRVRAGNTYAMPFVVNLGQRNATIVNGHLTPLRRILPQTGAFTIIGGNYDLIHSMNAVPLFARVPYIITFEDWMPRTPPDIRIGILERALTRVIAKNRCVALIAMSQYAKSQMMMQQRDSRHYDAVHAKTEVIYPAVKLSDHRPKKLGDSLHLLFVGADFMRKGLPAVLTAHAALEKLIPVHTTVVSSLRWSRHDYVGPNHESIVEGQKAALHHPGVTVLGSQPNEIVRQLMESHHFLVLPTFHDTFGYVALEAMAVGTPVIATDTCALPEIIDPESGILLPFPTDVIGRWQWLYQKDHPDYDCHYLATNVELAQAIVHSLLDMWDHKEQYEAMSARALARIAARFDQTHARDQLENLYARATRVFQRAPF